MKATPDKKKKYTYADYLQWPEGERWELIAGTPYDMSPAPSDQHQEVSWEISRQLGNWLADKKCVGRAAPYDVIFPERMLASDRIIDVVQPDIVVICDPDKISDRGCRGAPDFIIEILSPSTASRDHILKLDLYEKNGVREYWIVDPVNQLITVRVLGADGKYGIPVIHDEKSTVASTVLDGLTVDFKTVFAWIGSGLD